MTKQVSDIEKITQEAERIFGSAELARNWLTQKNIALGDTPLSMLSTSAGAEEVRKILSAIAYGGVV